MNIFPDFTTLDHLKARASCLRLRLRLVHLHAISEAATFGDGHDYTLRTRTRIGRAEYFVGRVRPTHRVAEGDAAGAAQHRDAALRHTPSQEYVRCGCGCNRNHMHMQMPSSHLVLQMLLLFALRHLSVRSDCRCELCRKYVFSESHISEGSSSGQRASRGFFIYPCEHAFHVSCLYYVVRLLLIRLQIFFTLAAALGTSSETTCI